MNSEVISVDGSKALAVVEELSQELNNTSKALEELKTLFITAYKNDNLKFYAGMGKLLSDCHGEVLDNKLVVDKISEIDLPEHINRMKEFSEN